MVEEYRPKGGKRDCAPRFARPRGGPAVAGIAVSENKP